MASWPLLPIDHKGLTCAQAADLLRGLADLIEAYPAEGIVLTVNVEGAATDAAASKAPRKKRTSG